MSNFGTKKDHESPKTAWAGFMVFFIKIGFFKIQVKDWQKRLGYA